MAANQVQRRRGTAAQCNAMTPALAEAVIDTTNNRWRIGDGLTAGGIAVPNAPDMQVNLFNTITAGGTGNAITGTLSPGPSGYNIFLGIKFVATSTNTGAVTINLNGLGLRDIRKVSGGSVVALAAGDIVAGGIYYFLYDGTNFQLINQTSSGLVSVSQGDLNTSQGTFSLAATSSGPPVPSGSLITMPGGQYGFSIESSPSVPSIKAGFWYGNSTVIYASTVYAWATSNCTVFGRQRYIASSPPFDLGDGEVGGFVFLLLNANGDTVATYAADVPPWGYNGPTDIRATHKCPKTGKKFRRVCVQSFEDRMNGRPVKFRDEEITHAIKNKDMVLIPHPFGDIPAGHKVIMLDPMDNTIRNLINYQNEGANDVQDIIASRLKIDNDSVSRKGPRGVSVHKIKYRFNK